MKMNQLIFVMFFSLSLLLSASLYAQDRQFQEKGSGTGWVVSQGHIITNHHVVGKYKDVLLVDTRKNEFYGKVVAVDAINDIAVIKVLEDVHMPVIFKLASRPARIGEKVFTIGFPYTSVMGFAPKMTTGIINSLTGVLDDPRNYQMSVPIQPGNSGGPLINMKGELVGLTTSTLKVAKMAKDLGSLPQGVNYAIKSYYVFPVLDSANILFNPDEGQSFSEGEGLPDMFDVLQKAVFRVHAGEFKGVSSSSTGQDRNVDFNGPVEISFWDGYWTGNRDDGEDSGACSYMNTHSLDVTIRNGKVRLEQTNPSGRTKEFKGSIDEMGNFSIDKAYVYKGSYDGNVLAGEWEYDGCKGAWYLQKD